MSPLLIMICSCRGLDWRPSVPANTNTGEVGLGLQPPCMPLLISRVLEQCPLNLSVKLVIMCGTHFYRLSVAGPDYRLGRWPLVRAHLVGC
jgi:hypothetical protein